MNDAGTTMAILCLAKIAVDAIRRKVLGSGHPSVAETRSRSGCVGAQEGRSTSS